MNLQTKKAFTLVELIVVITILAILSTIGFLSLQWFTLTSRDSVRITDISNIKHKINDAINNNSGTLQGNPLT